MVLKGSGDMGTVDDWKKEVHDSALESQRITVYKMKQLINGQMIHFRSSPLVIRA